MNLRNIIGNNLKYYRYQQGKSQEKFYTELGLNFEYYADVERGRKNISVDYIELLASKLNISSADLVTLDNTKIITKKRIDAKDKTLVKQ